ncbi:MAG: hypothetical protein AB1371_10990 [Pseudomonadota bacterium]
MDAHWPDLAVAVTEQAIESVDHLLRGLALLQQRGRITEAEYRILAVPALRLKHCGIQAQQIVRLQSGQVRQSHEKVDLAQVVAAVLDERRDALLAQGVTVQRRLQPVELFIDPTLAYSLVQTLLEWGVQHGSQLEVGVEPRPAEDGAHPAGEPPPRRAWLELAVWPTDATAPASARTDGVLWLLAQQLARTDGGIVVQREVEAAPLRISATFRRAVAPLHHRSAQPGDRTGGHPPVDLAQP